MAILLAALAFIPLACVLIIFGAVWRGFLGMLALGIAHSYQPEFILFKEPLGFGTCFLIALVVGFFVPTSTSTDKD